MPILRNSDSWVKKELNFLLDTPHTKWNALNQVTTEEI